MKTFIIFSLASILILPAFADSRKTKTTRTYEETTSSPQMSSGTRSNMGTGASTSHEMIEAEEYDEPLSTEEADRIRMDERQRMEERDMKSSTVINSKDSVDYSDRTRTNRERKALNTSSHASDDN